MDSDAFKFAWRFKNNPALQSKYVLLNPDQTRGLAKRLITVLPLVTTAHSPNTLHPSTMRCIESMEPDGIRAVLGSFQPYTHGRVYCYWPRDVVAIELDYADFVESFDDIWYPSSDDLIVTDASVRFVTYFDHEEWIRHVVLRQSTRI